MIILALSLGVLLLGGCTAIVVKRVKRIPKILAILWLVALGVPIIDIMNRYWVATIIICLFVVLPVSIFGACGGFKRFKQPT